jgi:hypothetical protein
MRQNCVVVGSKGSLQADLGKFDTVFDAKSSKIQVGAAGSRPGARLAGVHRWSD